MARQRDDEQTPSPAVIITDLSKAPERLERTTTLDAVDRKSWDNILWLALQITATLNGRDVLRNAFPYREFLIKHGKRPLAPSSWTENSLNALRILCSSIAATISMIFAAKALFLYSSLPILALLPILSNIIDSILFRVMYILGAGSGYMYQKVSSAAIYRTVLAMVCITLITKDEFYLNPVALPSALTSFTFSSLSKFVATRPRKDHGLTLQLFQDHLLASLVSLLIVLFTTNKYENIHDASQAVKSWGSVYYMIKLGPSVLLYVFFKNWMLNTPFFVCLDYFGGDLEIYDIQSRDSATSTFQAGLFIILLGTLNKERCFMEWKQAVSFSLIYISYIGPKHIGPSLLRFLNFKVFRAGKDLYQKSVPSQYLLLSFAAFFSSFMVFWVNIVSYRFDVVRWHDSDLIDLDAIYQPPQIRSIDIVIAHSSIDDIADVAWLVQAFGCLPHYNFITPNIHVYSQDPNVGVDQSTTAFIRGEFKGDMRINRAQSIGGSTAIYINHILSFWDVLPDQTLFLSTTGLTQTIVQNTINRLTWYYEPLARPLPDALPKTGFLNLGPTAVCSCHTCVDHTGWSDILDLVPSLWAATRPNTLCGSILLTYGNRFIASAERLRGQNHDTWQLLYNVTVAPDVRTAWNFTREKLLSRRQGKEVRRGVNDSSSDKPGSSSTTYFGLDLERMWGVLLQCSRVEIAWKCPPFHFAGLRLGSANSDCGCID
ncbi:hypothetical protein K3495_g2851 [Podosphaera aphanis]|nr:hypothetical protein K3495_g2851 [Podosphaera aphanis]